jgi:phosphate-selective porin OprO and OprP
MAMPREPAVKHRPQTLSEQGVKPVQMVLRVGAGMVLTAGLGGPVLAQSAQAPQATTGGGAATAGVDYVIPDLPLAKPKTPEQLADPFTFRVSLALLGDWTAFSQDETSIAQVGEQEDQFQLRSARLQFLGTIGSGYKVSYQLGAEYKGFAADPEYDWNFTDITLTFPVGKHTKFIVGKQKEPFVYEMVGDAANLAVSERVLSPFFTSRNMGVRVQQVLGKDRRGTFSVGVYNDDWNIRSSANTGWDFAGRLTGLLWVEPEGNRFLHMGAAVRIIESKGEIRYRGRPGSNVASNFVDTGNFAADGALHYGFEAMLGLGPVSFLGEHVTAQVDSPTLGNPEFSGWYASGSWVLTGESRPYDRNVGYARRVNPKGRWGAPEVVVRYGEVDLRDGQVDGGRFERLDLGLNWWATTRWKFGVAFGQVWSEKDAAGIPDGAVGDTTTLLTRVQWVY